MPGARVRPTEYRVGPLTVTDGSPRTVRLPEIPGHTPQEPQPLAAAAVVAAFAAVALGASRARRLAEPSPDLDAVRADGRLAASAALLAAVLAVVTGLAQR